MRGGGGKEDLDADADRRKEDQRHDRKMMQDEEDVEAWADRLSKRMKLTLPAKK